MKYKDYYAIMDLSRDATQDEIKRAYRKLARRYHPDVSKELDAEAHFKEVGEAYEVLKDPEKRAAYDQLGSDWQAGQTFRPPPQWDQNFAFHGGGFTEADPAAFSDFFAALFGGSFTSPRDRAARQARGEDAHAQVTVSLRDAYEGATHTITLQQTEPDSHGRFQVKPRTLRVRIPKGIRQGQHIRLVGQGGRGHDLGQAGDLYLEVTFSPDPRYRIVGGDVYLELPVTPWEAALGTTVTVPTPTGKLDLKIPANSAAGRKLRLKGRGIPGNPPGDFYVVLQVVLPPADTETAKQFYREMGKQLAFNPRKRLED